MRGKPSKMARALTAAVMLVGACGASNADNLAPAKEIHAGEIGLKGTVTDAGQTGQLSMSVTEVVSASTKPVILKPARDKSVSYGPELMRLANGVTRKADGTALHDGDTVLAIGPSSEQGEPMDARVIVILSPGTPGFFAFPQDAAQILCDTTDLRVSAWNDSAYLYLQSIIWSPGDSALTDVSGQQLGPNSDIAFDLDGDLKRTPHLDRRYMLNPWASMPGLRYQIQLSERGTSGLMSDSKGHGAIRFVDRDAGRIRVDSYVIPLAEISKKPGDTVRLVYYANNPKTNADWNSAGFAGKPNYQEFEIPMSTYNSVTLAKRPGTLDVAKVPDGQKDRVADK